MADNPNKERQQREEEQRRKQQQQQGGQNRQPGNDERFDRDQDRRQQN